MAKADWLMSSPTVIESVRYAELHSHTAYSFKEGASQVLEMLSHAKEIGISAIAITDHDNLCGAMEFAQTAKALGIKPIIGVEATLVSGHHLTLLAETSEGYRNICRLVTRSYMDAEDRKKPGLAPELFAVHSEGVICLSGCRKSQLAERVDKGDIDGAMELVNQYLGWFGNDSYFIEMQQNLVKGDTARNRTYSRIASETGIGLVATGNAHYHAQDRFHLNDALESIRHNSSLEETESERRINDQFFLKSPRKMRALFDSPIFGSYPKAIENTIRIAERCTFDITSDAIYSFPTYEELEKGETESERLRGLCQAAAVRKYGAVTPVVTKRLDAEFHLVERHGLAGFLLQYYDIIKIARDVQIDLGMVPAGLPVEDQPPGRGRGSSVALLIGYLIGLSHIDPLQFDLKLERFLPDDEIAGPPDIDLDFPREIREQLILRVHERWGPERAALTGMISTYKVKGALRDLGKAFALPDEDISIVAKALDGHGDVVSLVAHLATDPQFTNSLRSATWKFLVELAFQLEGFPKYLAQHPGGMILSARPLSETVPVQPSAMDGRYIVQWDKNAADDAGFVKIDFLALGALSQMIEVVEMIRVRHEEQIDLSRIDFEDKKVYASIHAGDTVGTFQIESAAQRQTVIRLKPKNLVEMAWEVAAVRPGVGVNDGVTAFIHRHNGEPWDFDHPLEKEALERTYGVPIYQDQLEELARYVAGFSPGEAAAMRKAYTRTDASRQVPIWRNKFISGAIWKGVPEEIAEKIAGKFHGHYQFPESHAYAFGITAYQMQWLKVHYPLEFLVGLFNNQPMGFYNLESLKEDGRHHGIKVLNPDVNRSGVLATIDDECLRPGFAHVGGISKTAADMIVEVRERFGVFESVAMFMERTGLKRAQLDDLARSGAFDSFNPYPDEHVDRRNMRWEVGLRYRPVNTQYSLSLPVEPEMQKFTDETDWQKMMGEYGSLGFFPKGHVMQKIRDYLSPDIRPSNTLDELNEGDPVKVAGMRFRLQHPNKNVYFVGLEDEFGHTELILWPRVYQKVRKLLHGSNLLIASGTISRREGTLTVLVGGIEPIELMSPQLQTKDWG